MPKQTVEKSSNQRMAEAATLIGAWILTAAALLASTEKLMHAEQGHAALPAHGHSTVSYTQPEAIRAEGARETARLPEEYDVGLRMPAVSGA